MRELDETDLEILQLLLEDARRPFSEIADAVDLSHPTVSDRVARLEEMDVIHRFTLDIDRSQIQDGISVLLTLQPQPAAMDRIHAQLRATNAVDHVFLTADNRLICHCHLPDNGVREWLAETVDLSMIDEHTVTILAETQWTPTITDVAFALSCAECGKPVTGDGITTRIDQDLYHFCCASCEARFTEQYERLQNGTVKEK